MSINNKASLELDIPQGFHHAHYSEARSKSQNVLMLESMVFE